MPQENATSPDALVWLVCRCNPARMVRSVRDRLVQLGVEHYMATHRVLQRRGDRMVEVEESYLGSYCFVRASRRQAMQLRYSLGVDINFVRIHETYAGGGATSDLLTVSEQALDDFRRVIEEKGDKVNYQADPYAVGDEVIVLRGPLVGVRGTLIRVDNRDHLMLRIPGLFAISVGIGRSYLRKLAAAAGTDGTRRSANPNGRNRQKDAAQ